MNIRAFALIVILTANLAEPANAAERCDHQAQIWLDDTGSVAAASVDQTALNAVRTLAQSPLTESICRIDLYQFADQAIYATPFHQVQLPASKAPECTATAVSSELAVLKRVQKAEAARLEKSCSVKREEWAKDQAMQLHSELAKAQTAIEGRRRLQAQCTALTDVARRLTRTPSPNVKLAIVVTDGIQTCDSSAQAIQPPKVSLQAYMVVMPNNVHRNTGTELDKIIGNWRRLASWISVVLPDELTEVLR